MKNEESRLQIACVRWFKLQYPNHIIFAIPNGGNRGIVTASIMKAEGVLKGVPDLFIPHPSWFPFIKYSGLFIEMKTEKGKISSEQKELHEKLRAELYRVEVVRSFDEFQTVVNDYLSDKS